MHVYRCQIEWRIGARWDSRTVDVLAAPDGYRLRGFAQLADRPRVVIGAGA